MSLQSSKVYHKYYYNSKGKGLDTCYSAAYMGQTRDQQHFTISEVAADWCEPMVQQYTTWPSTAAVTDSWTCSAASRHTIAPISHSRPSPHSLTMCKGPYIYDVYTDVGRGVQPELDACGQEGGVKAIMTSTMKNQHCISVTIFLFKWLFLCPCDETQTMSHIVESCPLTKLNGGLSRLHSAD